MFLSKTAVTTDLRRGPQRAIIILSVAALAYTLDHPAARNDGTRSGGWLSSARAAEVGDLLSSFDTSDLRIPRSEILPGGPPKDGIPSLTEPRMVPAKSARQWRPSDRVVVVTINTEARAYPLNVLTWHEAVNDRVDGVPIAVIFCPLCDSVTVVDRRIDEKVLEFGISGLLHNSNVLLYDRQDHALWSQIGLIAVSGPHAGQSLRHQQFEIITYRALRDRHPDATVMTFDTGHRRDYRHNPYAAYLRSPELRFPVSNLDDRMRVKDRVVGVRLDHTTRAYPIDTIREQPEGRLIDEIDGRRIVIETNLLQEGQARRIQPEVRITELPEGAQCVHAFWFAWAAFHPQTDLYHSGVSASRPTTPEPEPSE